MTIKKSTYNKCWSGCGEKGTLLYCWWDYKLVQPLWTVWRFLQKNIELPNDPLIPLLGIYLEETILQKETGTPVFIAALFTVAKIWKQPKCPLTKDQIKKMWYLYTMEYYSATKKNKIVPFADILVDPEIVILIEVSQKAKNIIY